MLFLKMLSKYKVVIGFVIAILIFSMLAFLLTPPAGYSAGRADWVQSIRLKDTYKYFFYTWADRAEGSLFGINSYFIYYLPFYILDKIGLYSLQSFLYIFIFLFASFLTFYFSQRLFIADPRKNKSILMALLYALNPYTLVFVTSVAIFSPFNMLYVFLPLFFGLIYSYLIKGEKLINTTLGLFVLYIFIMATSFGNFPFLVGAILFENLFIFLLFVFSKIKVNWFYFKKIFLLQSSFILASLYSILFQAWHLYGIQKIISGTAGIQKIMWVWYVTQRRSLLNQFIFNYNFIDNHYVLGGLLTFLFILTFVISKTKHKLIPIFTSLALIAMFITSKGIEFLPKEIVIYIFTLPIISSLRSESKTFLFVPFFLIVVIYLSYTQINSNRKRIFYWLFICLVLFSVLYKIWDIVATKKNISLYFKSPNEYYEKNQSIYFKIPAEYYEINKKLEDYQDNKILVLPYSVTVSQGWVKYMWPLRFMGGDPITQILDKPNIHANSPLGDSDWIYAEIWNRQKNKESQWLLPFSGIINAKYILYHKDVEYTFVKQTIEKMQYYEKQGYIKKIDQNRYFDLFEINDSYFLPHIYIPQTLFISSYGLDKFPEILSRPDYSINSASYFTFQNNISSLNYAVNTAMQFKSQNNSSPRKKLLDSFAIPTTSQKLIKKTLTDLPYITVYKKVSPIKYYLTIRGKKEVFPLVLSESFHNGWKIYLQESKNGGFWETWFSKPLFEDSHLVANGYANSWIINAKEVCNGSCIRNADGTYTLNLILEFWPQRLWIISLAISGFFSAVCLIIISFVLIKKKGKRHMPLQK